jgi:8-oxo-dGTP diphosphatase
MNTKKHICVAAALLFQNGKIFATKRGDSPYPYVAHKYEFPGGKIEAGEKPEQALIREIKEELAVKIEVGELLHTVEYDYPTFHLTMHCFVCILVSGELELKEHQAAKWLTKETLDSVEWLPADVEVAEKVKGLF